MAVTELNPDSKDESKRQVSAFKYPYYALADSVAVAQTIHAKGGGAATLDELAAHLNYAGVNNGAFKSRLAAARMFGLVEKSGDKFVITQLAQAILMPHYEWMPKEGLAKAFLSVELFARIYDEYKGKQLPPEFGLKNALKTMFGVAPPGVERAYRVLIESADTAGFFETRAGARTHLILPTINKGAATVAQQMSPDAQTGGGDGGGGDGGDGGGRDVPGSAGGLSGQISGGRAGSGDSGRPPSGIEGAKARYIQALINVLEEKGKTGELDEALMGRIEKLLEAK